MTPGAGRGSAHGKVILCGEHAVVYGEPAIAMALSRGTRVTVTPADGPVRLEGPGAADARLTRALHTELGAEGWQVSITSDLPIGRGLGSSAALSVALVRAHAEARSALLSDDAVTARALALETVFHGTPSGLDNAIAARGGVLRFVRRGDAVSLTPLPPPPWGLVVLDSGAAGDTHTLVASVRALGDAARAPIARIGALVDAVTAHLHDAEAVGALLTENHALLRELGVSTPTLDTLVALALTAGAHGAKLAGAGGGGVVLAICHDTAPVLHAARQAGVSAWAASVAALDASAARG